MEAELEDLELKLKDVVPVIMSLQTPPPPPEVITNPQTQENYGERRQFARGILDMTIFPSRQEQTRNKVFTRRLQVHE